MDDISRERAKTFISQSMEKTKSASAETLTSLQNLVEIFSQYSSVIEDALEAKSKYIEVVEKYLDNNSSVGIADYFPGLKHKGPIGGISSTDMETDSKDMDQMANLVKDLEIQKNSLEDQLERTFKKSVGNIHQIESLSAQSSDYLDSMISDIGEIYGSMNMNQLIQKSSL